jgi:Ca2+-binding RTX toxin-like protein
VKSAANKYQLPALLLNKLINLKYKGTTEMATIKGTQFNDNNTVNGGKLRPSLVGANEADSIYGYAGNDILSGLDGNDNLYGGHGGDILSGGYGEDYLDGGNRRDKLFGGYGNDVLAGDLDNDTLYGQQGNDILHGGYNNDILYGGSGNDVLVGWRGTGNEEDTLTGNGGADRFVLGDQLRGVFYTLDDESVWSYYARITDFKKKDGDKVQVVGNQSNYVLEKDINLVGGSAKDTLIYFKSNLGNTNLIGVVQDTTNISFSDFTFKIWG